MITTPTKYTPYTPPVISNYGQDSRSEDLANLVIKRKLTKKSISDITIGSDKLYGYEGGAFAVYAATAANVAAVVNAVVYATAAAVTLAVAVAAVVTFPGNIQGVITE